MRGPGCLSRFSSSPKRQTPKVPAPPMDAIGAPKPYSLRRGLLGSNRSYSEPIRPARLAVAKRRGVKLGGRNAQSEKTAAEASARAERLRPILAELSSISANQAGYDLAQHDLLSLCAKGGMITSGGEELQTCIWFQKK
jgi:hypothetical protein